MGSRVCPCVRVICVCGTVLQRGLLFLLDTLRLDSSQGALQGRWQMASVGRGSVPGAEHRLPAGGASHSHREAF